MEISLLAMFVGFVLMLSAWLMGTLDTVWLTQTGALIFIGGLIIKFVGFLQDRAE